ncbi:protein I'm not dead yet-like [Ostrinia nubilalis]|uniref:protein I'm not dead yet-like n=1 Tax=Ostrinia nubilalis TaxID=29057 RepID=UPI0030826A3B
MESDSDTNLVILTKRVRLKLFCRLYWRLCVLLTTPILLLPVYVLANTNAYKCFYIFLVCAIYWITDTIHPGVISLMPITLYTLLGTGLTDSEYLNQIFIRSELLDCISIMMITVAIEESKLNRRAAIKLMMVFGCSHYRLSFILFFSCMFLAMWISDIIACGLMMPLVKAVLVELEKMGILEMHHAIGKTNGKHYELKSPKPTDFTVFYFLGIAYSSSIGSIATIAGSQTNQIFKLYCESLFPSSPKIEFPHLFLLNLPAVLLMEALLYMWMNFYFLGMFRARSDIALEIGMSEEEAEYISTLLKMQYQQLGKIHFHEAIVGAIILLTCILQSAFNSAHFNNYTQSHSHLKTSAPSMFCVILLFVSPINLSFIKFFKRRGNEPLPMLPARSCLTWKMVQNNVSWCVLFIIASSCSCFEALKESRMTDEFGNMLMFAINWPAPVLALLVISFCKVLSEFASNSCSVYCLLPAIARLSVASSVNPHYLMLASTLSCSLSFHLVTGSPVNAMVAAYVAIPPWKMMSAGVGPSVIAIAVCWFTVAVWSKAIWTDIHLRPEWAEYIHFDNKNNH